MVSICIELKTGAILSVENEHVEFLEWFLICNHVKKKTRKINLN